MPIPKPEANEEKEKFIERCMADDVMNSEYPDEKQRYAVCQTAWDEKKSAPNDVERRYLISQDAEFRMGENEAKQPTITGYFAKFNVLSQDLGGFKEKIEPGFFRKALETCDVVDLFNHDANYILGRMSAGTLRVWEDNKGLAYECIPPDTQTINDLVLTPIKRGDIKGNSFGFRVKQGGDLWEQPTKGLAIRTLKPDGCDLLTDGSQVVFPAYLQTSLSLRTLEAIKNLPSEAGADESEVKETVDCLNDLKRRRFNLL